MNKTLKCTWKKITAAWMGVSAAVILLVPFDVWAQIADAEARIDSKFADIRNLATKVAWGIIGVGAVVIGVKMNKGDPDTGDRAWKFILGALLVYLAPQIVEWIKQ